MLSNNNNNFNNFFYIKIQIDVDVISGSINNPDDTQVELESQHPHRPDFPVFSFPESGSLFNNFFGAPFFNTFGLGGLGSRRTPWWKG